MMMTQSTATCDLKLQRQVPEGSEHKVTRLNDCTGSWSVSTGDDDDDDDDDADDDDDDDGLEERERQGAAAAKQFQSSRTHTLLMPNTIEITKTNNSGTGKHTMKSERKNQ